MLDARLEALSDRKLRLFGCACCRRIWNQMGPADRDAVLLAERYADGEANETALFPFLVGYGPTNAATAARAVASPQQLHCHLCGRETRVLNSFQGPVILCSRFPPCPWTGVSFASGMTAAAVAAVEVENDRSPADFEDMDSYQEHYRRLLGHQSAEQADLLREVVGNPFRQIDVRPDWVTPVVASLAWASYTERAFDRLPILADALEDAGCADDAILLHLRGPGPHVRGCWALDRLLGKD